jgi:hypothetical protein
MKSFDIDLYLWYEPADTWLWVPPHPSTLEWSITLSQDEILSCEAGFTFRVDNVLWLGNERDSFPLKLVCYELDNTLCGNSQKELLARLPISENLTVEIRQGPDDLILLSRLGTREVKDYFEQVAHKVGTYYKDFAVEYSLWRAAVNRSLNGLALIFGASEPSGLPVEQEKFGQWLLNRYQTSEEG